MIDTTNAKWDFSKEEKYVIKWFDDNGFKGKIIKQYVSKTIFEIEKDNIVDKFELPQGIVFHNISSYMKQFQKKLGYDMWIKQIETIKKRALEMTFKYYAVMQGGIVSGFGSKA